MKRGFSRAATPPCSVRVERTEPSAPDGPDRLTERILDHRGDHGSLGVGDHRWLNREDGSMNMARAEIKNHIRRLRFEHGEMTQQALADAAGCTRQTILLLEQSRYTPSLALAFRIARTFNVRIDQVFELTES